MRKIKVEMRGQKERNEKEDNGSKRNEKENSQEERSEKDRMIN